MGNTTTKQIGKIDGDQVLRKAYVVEDGTIAVNGFLAGKVGHRVEITDGGTTEVFQFIDNSVSPAILLYEITLTYTDGTKETLVSAERTA